MIYRKVVERRMRVDLMVGKLFTMTATASAGGGLTLRAGDEIRVLERDGDSILIEVLGDADNPYFVSGELLSSISDFPGEETVQRE